MDIEETGGAEEKRNRERRWAWGLVVLVACVAALPSLGTLGAGLISDDGAALGYVHRMGAFSDWFRPEYDVHTFRFWRPLVTVSLGLQESLTGVAPVPLRLFNLVGHIATALLAMLIARQLGANRIGAALVGCLVGLFPYQGGTVTWIVGRVDSQCVPLALGAIAAALGGRSWWAGGLLFLALASKEVALAVPFAVVCLVWARGQPLAAAKRPLFVLFGVLAATIVWRRLAIGTWSGGYTGGLASAFPQGYGVAELRALAGAVWSSMDWLLGALGVALVLSSATRARPRLLLGALLAGALALAPLVRSLAPGVIDPEHRRILMLADALFCIGFAVAFTPKASRLAQGLGGAVVLVLIGQRAHAAWQDTHTWAAAGNLAESYVTEIHDTLVSAEAHVEPSQWPVLRAAIPRTQDGAYVLHWGVADRFRAPFPETPRPVWPWRAVFEGPELERNSVTRPERNLRWPFGRGRRMVPPLIVTRGEPEHLGEPVEEIEIAADLFTEPGPLLAFEGVFPGARFEVLCFTELGYGIGLFGGPKLRGAMRPADEGPVEAPFGGRLSLRDLLQLEPRGTGTGGPQLWEVLALAADFGAREAYLEFRAVDDGRGKLDRAVGASAWIHLVWGPELREAVKPFSDFE